MTSSAPAKINLSLRVLRRREDGFHEIATRMVPLALADELTISLPQSGSPVAFTCSNPDLPVGSENLVIRAVEALRGVAGPLPPLEIHLQKHIPHGAGLGGGSSDAAATLRALNDLLQLGCSVNQLLDLAASLGSDVPFFVHRQMCDCSGRGEIVAPAAEPAPAWEILLLKPPFPVPTPWAYQQWQSSHEIPGVMYAAQHVDGISLHNDLERPVFAKHLFLADLKMWLLEQPEVSAALLCGSGSTLFAVLRPASPPDRLVERVREEMGQNLWICRTRTLGRA